MASFRFRMDQISHCLGLSQIELSIEEGTLRKFSRLSNTGSLADKKLDDLIDDVGRAMRGNLHHIFFGKRTRCYEKGNEDFVNNFFAISYGAQGDRVRRLVRWVFAKKNFIGQSYSIFSGQTYYRSGTYALWGSQCNKGIFPFGDIQPHL